ncbi:hypothetical protein X907_0707 [Glycocaulis alkaliphilus]|uniref:Uncharacterized protein n=1 Tax=Glycocaulis alkaliphilus TaxID=1434191 RepID=A0A3T0E785_9PROT|nr:hypothetical protein [Glycocaulis alkaliphilus]AZU03251.1 hypothetical protein X907_0707 [Glycocaulis alkaliphilus]GGB72154.1 hypothetical protein GCM10007417_09980 [Glycocaulis alkaliphilus]
MDTLTDRAFAMAKAGQGDGAAITALRIELAAQAGRITSDMDRLELAKAGIATDLDRLAGELDPLDAALMALDRLAQGTGAD